MIKIGHAAIRFERSPDTARRPAVLLDGVGPDRGDVNDWLQRAGMAVLLLLGSIGAVPDPHDARAASMAVSPGQDASP